MKKCSSCKELLDVSKFHKSKTGSHGVASYCKTCNAKYLQDWSNKNRSRVNELSRKSYNNNLHYFRKRDLKRRLEQPWKIEAKNAVNYAIKVGKLKREPCVVCGKENVIGHHEDYSNKIDVTWLCRPHHIARHQEMDKLGIDPSAAFRG